MALENNNKIDSHDRSAYRVGKRNHHELVTGPDVQVLWIHGKLCLAVSTNLGRDAQFAVSVRDVALFKVQTRVGSIFVRLVIPSGLPSCALRKK